MIDLYIQEKCQYYSTFVATFGADLWATEAALAGKLVPAGTVLLVYILISLKLF